MAKHIFHSLFLGLPVLLISALALIYVGTSVDGYSETGATSAVADGGTIEGVIRFPEDFPEKEKITVTKDQATCGAFQYSELFVVSEETQGLANALIFLKGVEGRKQAIEGSTATLDQKKCRYLPHIQAVPVGTTLEILNNDGLLHNVHAYLNSPDPKNTVFNKAQPKFLKKIKQKLDQVGIYHFKCDVHNHMSAYVATLDHPYYSVSDEAGGFTIQNVPAGDHTVVAWHEVLGEIEKEVTVEPGKTATVTFDILPNE